MSTRNKGSAHANPEASESSSGRSQSSSSSSISDEFSDSTSSSGVSDDSSGSSSEQPQEFSLPCTHEMVNKESTLQPNYRKVCTVSEFDDLTEEGNAILENINRVLGGSRKETVNIWLRDIDQIRAQPSKRKSPTIAIVGATGAGKSSLINCLLGPMQLLPTNCVRACTASPTEISLNSKTDGPPHLAKIEFISMEDWRQELESLLGDLVEADGSLSKDRMKKDSEAQIAWWKVKSVYPHHCDTNMAQLDIEQLMQIPQVREVLGTRLCFTASTPVGLQKQIERYIDSRDRPAVESTLRRITSSSSDSIEYWPLIRKISIQTKAPILETGCVLVDLPGIGDSNKARGSVAASYLQHCTSLWVVSPISRAADDKHARTLLGEAFKRQMFRDGTLDRTTFICSKIDDINVTEAKANFALYPAFAEIIDPIDAEKAAHFREITELKRVLSSYETKAEWLKQQLQRVKAMEKAYTGYEKQIKNGKIKHPFMFFDSTKRKNSNEGQQPGKRPKLGSFSHLAKGHPTAVENVDGRNSDSQKGISTPKTEVLILEDLSQNALTLSEFHRISKGLVEERTQLSTDLRQNREDYRSDRDDLDNLKKMQLQNARTEWLACVKQRNLYATEALKSDFTAGIQDIHRSEAERDDLNFDPTAERSGEANVKRYDLPVYCISSRGYQLFISRQSDSSMGEPVCEFFDDVADTGVPSLVDHARHMGSEYLQQLANDYINDVNRLLSSLRIWSGSTTSDMFEESKTMVQENIEVSNMISTFFEILQYGINAALKVIADNLLPQVMNKLPQATKNAMEKATPIYRKWEALHWTIYCSVARRHGRYVKGERDVDFHTDLLQPFTQRVDPIWNNILNEQIPETITESLENTQILIRDFKKNFRIKLFSRGVSDTGIDAFEEQADRFDRSLRANVQSYKDVLQVGQREANRKFSPSIEEHMLPVYPLILGEHGPGCYKRMKTCMHNHISEHKEDMFSNAEEQSSEKLESVQEEARDTLTKEVLHLSATFQNDCTTLAAQKPTEAFTDLDANIQAAVLQTLNETAASFGMFTEEDQIGMPDGIPAEPESNVDALDNSDFSEIGRPEPIIIEVSDDDNDF